MHEARRKNPLFTIHRICQKWENRFHYALVLREILPWLILQFAIIPWTELARSSCKLSYIEL